MIHTKNLVFGEARNPHNVNRSCGGSSGGDAGMVASKCVPFSIGTDMGGSIRFPAAFCGVYGFKPTNGRTTSYGVPPPRIKRDKYASPGPVPVVLGPLGSSVDDIIANCQVMFDGDVHKMDPL